MNPQLWSWLLAAIGITGMWLAGRRPQIGWTVGIAAQGLWVAYALATGQYGFLLSCTGYATVYALNLRRALAARVVVRCAACTAGVHAECLALDSSYPPAGTEPCDCADGSCVGDRYAPALLRARSNVAVAVGPAALAIAGDTMTAPIQRGHLAAPVAR